MFRFNKRATCAIISKLSLTLLAGAALAFIPGLRADPGDLYVTNLATGSVIKYAPDGTFTTFASGLTSPQGIVFDQAKNLYVADAGNGGAGNGSIFKYTLSGTKTTFRSGMHNPIGLTTDGSDLLVAESGVDRVLRLPLDGVNPPSILQIIPGPFGVTSRALKQAGFFRYISNGPLVREIAPGNVITDFNFSADPSRGVIVNATGNVFVTTSVGTVSEIPADGGARFTFASGFTEPTGMDFRPARFGGDMDRVGFLYVADTLAGKISQIAVDGTKTTFVTGAGNPNFIAFEVIGPSPTPTPIPTPTPSPTPTPTPTPPDRAQNLSTRADVETGANVAIGGFGITGTDPRLVVIRGIGPALAAPPYNLAGVLADPVLELHDSTGAIITSNDNWMKNSPGDRATLIANRLDPKNPSEAAIVMTLDPGLYTAILMGSNGGTGIGLVEIYDLDDLNVAGDLGNLSTRGFVGTGDKVMIGGLIVGPEGGADASFVVRALGPSLANFKVPNPLLDPVLQLFNGNGDLIAMNDNWETDLPPDNYAAEVMAAGLAPSDPAESAIFANLVAGLYTAIVTGQDETSGVGLVEIYHVLGQPAHSPGK